MFLLRGISVPGEGFSIGWRIARWLTLVSAVLLACSAGDEVGDEEEPVARQGQRIVSCDPVAPFGQPVPAFTGPLLTRGLTFSQDGRAIFLASRAAPTASYDIYTTTRATTADSFPLGALTSLSSTPPTPPAVAINGPSDERAAFLSGDGLRLYVEKLGSGMAYDLAVATRGNSSQSFSSALLLTNLNHDGLHDQDPFFLSSTNELYFASELSSGHRDIFVSNFANGVHSNALAVLGSPPQPINSGFDDYRPVLSSNGLRLYFASKRGGITGDTEGDIWTATRSATNQAFDPATPLYALNSSRDDFPVVVSNDGCTLYFASSRETTGMFDYRLYEATRAESTPATATVVVNIVGDGSINTAPFTPCNSSCWAQGTPGSTAAVVASGPAVWSGSCIPPGGNPSSDGVIVFTQGGVCTVTFASAGPPCSTSVPFGPITQFFPGTLSTEGLALSADELTAYVSRRASTNYDIYVTTRPNKTAPFGELTLVPNVNTSHNERGPWLSANGLELYFWVGYVPFGMDIWKSTRTSPSQSFGTPSLATSLNSGSADEDPFFAFGGSRVFFVSDRPGGDRDLWTTVRIDGAFTTPTKLPVLNTIYDFEEERRPILTADGLTMYFHSDRGGWEGDTNGDILISERASTTADFSVPTLVPGLNTQGREFPVALSRDACTLYFGSNRDDGAGGSLTYRLYRTRRGELACDPAGVNDGNPCTVDSCDAVGAPLHQPAPAGTSCADANACNGAEVCNGSGACVAGTAPPCDATCPCGPGGACQGDSGCASGLGCVDGACTCVPNCEGKCGGSDGCGGTCGRGAAGATCCAEPADCQEGLTCVSGTCMAPGCHDNPVATGCGYEGAPCGLSCTPQPICTDDADCPNGFVCPLNNGWRYGSPDVRVCVRPEWGCDEPHPPGGCGGPFAKCGVCDCTPACEGKQCGDTDLSDGCGGRCTGVCDASDLGCTLDADCQAGSICRASRCRPADRCGLPTIDPADCGPGSLCGPCPVRGQVLTTGRTCGPDPNGGPSFGSCAAELFCNGAGRCAKHEATPNIVVPNANGSTREVIPQPTTPGIGVGSIAGQFSVTDRGGAAYTIPLELPPGRSIKPELALRYTSTAGNGALGAGWSLDGLSEISRCAKIFALDGYNRAWSGAPDDAICLDGQRLVKLADGSYRTAIDTFRKVVPILDPNSGQPQSFKLFTKDGRIFSYGVDDGSRATWNGLTSTWALSKVEDRAANFMRFTYRAGVETPSGRNELVPHVITYTGHGEVDGDREIEFVYDYDRPDQYILESGMPSSRRHRLTTIVVRAQQLPVRRYGLTYQVTQNTSRLESIQECLAPFVCKPATRFDYMLDEFRFDAPVARSINSCVGNGCITPPKISGSGYTHWVTPGGSSLGGRDWMGAAVYDTYLTRVSPTLGVPAYAVSFVPAIGTAASTALTLLGIMLDSEDTLVNLYDIDLQARRATRTDSSCATPGTLYTVAEDPAVGDAEKLLMHCRGFVPTGKSVMVPLCASDDCPKLVEVEAWAAPRIWYIDVDGNGVQDKLFCDKSKLYLKLSRAHETGNAAVGGGGTTDYDFEPLNVPDLCRLDCAEAEWNLPPDPENPPPPPQTTCSEDRPFSSAFDVDDDGTSNLVFYSRLNGWFYFDYDADGLHLKNDLFEGVSLSATHKNYIAVLDANGDGLRDILGLPDAKMDPGGKPVILYNSGKGFSQQTLIPQGHLGYSPGIQAFVIDYDRDGVEELIEPTGTYQDPTELPHPWRLRRIKDGYIYTDTTAIAGGPGTIGDFDGDGALDVYTHAAPRDEDDENPYYLHRGRGRHNGLLKTVTDGLGRRVDVSYDETHAAAPDDAFSDLDSDLFDSSICKWPVRCPSRAPHPLVTTHTESHYTDQAHSEGGRVTENTSKYRYHQWLTELGGYGAFGFLSRKITTTDASGAQLSDTKIDYEPPTAGPRATPYNHPTAGLVKQVIEEGAEVSSRIGDPYAPRKVTVRGWNTQTSTSGLPFPALVGETKQYGVRGSYTEYPSQGPPYDIEGTTVHNVTQTVSAFDAYGNITHQAVIERDFSGEFPSQSIISASESSTEINRGFVAPDENTWLVGLVEFEETTSIPRCTSEDCEGLTKTRRYDFEYYPSTNLLHKSHRQLGDPRLEQHIVYERDQFGNVSAATKSDANAQNSRRVETTFDARGLFPITATAVGDGPNQTTQVRYDDRFGRLVARADPNGVDETWTYDELGIERHHRGPGGEYTTLYNRANPETSDLGLPILANVRFITTETGGEVSTAEFNSFGQPVRRSFTGFEGALVYEDWVYDEKQRLVERTRPHLGGDPTQGYFMFEYDQLDQLTAQTNPDAQLPNGQVLYDYSPVRRLWTDNVHWIFGRENALTNGATGVRRVVDANGNATVQVTNRNGLPIWVHDGPRVEDPQEGSTSFYHYEGFDKLHQIYTRNYQYYYFLLTMNHDDFGRMTEAIDRQRGGSESTIYNGLDEIVETRDALDRVATHFYDGFGRLERVEDTTDGETRYSYDGDGTQPNTIGRLVESLSPSGQRVTYGYEPRENGYNRGFPNNVTRHLTAQGGGPGSGGVRTLETRYTYNGSSRLERIDYPEWAGGNRLSVQYGYDLYGHNIRVSNATNPANVYWELESHDQGYRIGTERIGNAACGGTSGTETTRTYDPLRGTLSSVDTTCDTTAIQDLAYTYDHGQNLLSRNDGVAGTAESFGYDRENRLTHLGGVEAFAYEQEVGAFYSQAGVGTYAYDWYGLEGTLWFRGFDGGDYEYEHDAVGNTTRRPLQGGGSQTIDYTGFDLPRTVVNTTNQTATTNFSYEATGARAIKQRADYAQFYAGDLFQRRETRTETVHRAMVYAGGRAVAQVTQRETAGGTTNETRYLYSDNLGSIHTITTESGAIEELRAYSPFGRKTAAGDSDVPYGFTGHEEDDDLELINMKGRMYDPYIGQFLTADPIIQSAYGTGMNRFAYVRNSPTNYTDPSGFGWISVDDHDIVFDDDVLSMGGSTTPFNPNAITDGASAAIVEGSGILETASKAANVANKIAGAAQAVRAITQRTQQRISTAAPTNNRSNTGSDSPTPPARSRSSNPAAPDGVDGSRSAPETEWGKAEPIDPSIPQSHAPKYVDPLVGSDEFKGDPKHAENWDRLMGILAIFASGPEVGAMALGRGAAKLLAQRMARHHAWPKYLGGAAKQKLAELPKKLHEAFHGGLDKILPRQWGTDYYKNLPPEAKRQMMRDLANYTRAFDKAHGTKIYDALREAGLPGL